MSSAVAFQQLLSIVEHSRNSCQVWQHNLELATSSRNAEICTWPWDDRALPAAPQSLPTPAGIRSFVLKENQDVHIDGIFSKLLLPSRLWKCLICSATSAWWSPQHLFGTRREIFTGNQHDTKMHVSAPYWPCSKVAVLSSSPWQMSSGTCFFVLCKLIDSSWHPIHIYILRIPSKSTKSQAFEVLASQLKRELNILSAICSKNVSKNLLFWRGERKEIRWVAKVTVISEFASGFSSFVRSVIAEVDSEVSSVGSVEI